MSLLSKYWMSLQITEKLLEPMALKASKAIYDNLYLPFGNSTLQVLALADGYALNTKPDSYSPDNLKTLLITLIRYKKTVLIDNVSADTIRILKDLCRLYSRMQIVEVKNLQPVLFNPEPTSEETSSRNHVIAVFPNRYIQRSAVRRRAQEYQVLLPGEDILPKQSVHIIGIGLNKTMLTRRAIELIAKAQLVVTFDFVYDIIKHIDFQGEVQILDYDWETYPVNIDRMNEKLAHLHIEGHYDVTMVVEGNPEVYDLLSYLSFAGREYQFEVIAPVVVLCCAWITQHYGFDITDPSYVIVSGYTARHGITTQHLALELDAYMKFDLTCLVIEMYSGDLPLVSQHVRAAPRPKSIFIMINMFTPEQQIFILSSDDLDRSEWAERVKGAFISLAIVDEARLQREPKIYAKLLQDFAPDAISE